MDLTPHPGPPQDQPIPPALADALDRLREVIGKIPGGLAQAVRTIAATQARAVFGRPLPTVPGIASGPPVPAPPAPTFRTNATSRDPLAVARFNQMRTQIAQANARGGRSASSSPSTPNVGFAAAVDGFRVRFGRATGALAGGFERAFDASIGRVIAAAERGASGVASAARNPGAAASRAARAAASFTSSSASAFAATPGGLARAFRTMFGPGGSPFRQPGTGINPTSRNPLAVARFNRMRERIAQAGTRAGRAGRKARVGAYRQARARAGRHPGRGQALANRVAGGSMRRAGSAAESRFKAGGSRVGLGDVGAMVQAARLFDSSMRGLANFAERVSAGNKHLAPYSGQMMTAVVRQSLSDEIRTLKMAKANEGSASRLTNSVTVLRNAQAGTDTLSAGLMNRAGIAAAATATPWLKEVSGMATSISKWMEAKDPGGSMTKKLAEAPFDGTVYSAAYAEGLWKTGSFSGAAKYAEDVLRDTRRERAREEDAALTVSDGWTAFFDRALSLPPVNPPTGGFRL